MGHPSPCRYDVDIWEPPPSPHHIDTWNPTIPNFSNLSLGDPPTVGQLVVGIRLKDLLVTFITSQWKMQLKFDNFRLKI